MAGRPQCSKNDKAARTTKQQERQSSKNDKAARTTKQQERQSSKNDKAARTTKQQERQSSKNDKAPATYRYAMTQPRMPCQSGTALSGQGFHLLDVEYPCILAHLGLKLLVIEDRQHQTEHEESDARVLGCRTPYDDEVVKKTEGSSAMARRKSIL